MKWNDKVRNYTILLISELFYLFFAFADGYNLYLDSQSYIKMHEMREPLYPTVIALLRNLFGRNGDEGYLLFVVIFQALLIGYVIYNVTSYLSREFKLNDFGTFAVFFIFIAVSLMNRFVAKRGAMYSNSIMSEGIAYPLYILFIRYCFEYIYTYRKRPLFAATVISLLLVSTRKQMYVSLALIIISVFYVMIKNRSYKETVISLIVSCMVVIGGAKLFDYVYIRSVFGVNATHTSDSRFVTTMIFYTADREDAEYINDATVKELFLDIYDTCAEKGYLKSNMEDGSWYERISHFSKVYDNIQLRTMWAKMQEVAADKVGNSGIEMELLVDEYNSELISCLLPKLLPSILVTFVDSFIYGLLVTVSAEKQILMPVAAVIYLLYIVLLGYTIKKNGLDKHSLFGIFILLAVLVNIGLVSLVIFCQTRYTIYNMALFYASGFLMLYNLLFKQKGIKYDEEN